MFPSSTLITVSLMVLGSCPTLTMWNDACIADFVSCQFDGECAEDAKCCRNEYCSYSECLPIRQVSRGQERKEEVEIVGVVEVERGRGWGEGP